MCDDKCPAHKHSKLCSHTVAAAEFSKKTDPFIEWYKSSGHATSVTQMSEFGIDTKKSGRKPYNHVTKVRPNLMFQTSQFFTRSKLNVNENCKKKMASTK